MRRPGRHRVGLLSAGFCTVAALPLGAQHDVGDFLTPGIMEQVERQLQHTRDEDGKPLPGWYPQPYRPRIRITITEEVDVRIKQTNRNLDLIRVPRMSFKETPVREVVKSLGEAMSGSPRLQDNVNLRLRLSPNFSGPKKLTMEIEETTARKALEQVAEAMGATLIVEPFGVSIIDR